MDATTTRAEQLVERTRPRRDQWLGVGLSIVATLIGLIVLAWAILFITKGRFLKTYFEDYVSAQTMRRVDVAGDFQLYLNPINVKFRAEGLTISNPVWASRDNLFESRLVDASVATVPLLFGNRRINRLVMEQGRLDLEWDEAGERNTWTLGDPNREGEPFELPAIRRAYVAGSTLRYVAPQMDFVTDVRIETVRASDTAFDEDVRFTGTGSSHDRPFTISGSLMSPNETAAGGRNRLRLLATGAGNRLAVAGTLRGATELEGAQLRLQATGPNLASLVDFLGAATPPTRRYDLRSNLTRRDGDWRFTGIGGTFGDSDIAGALTLSMPEDRLLIEGDLRSQVLDIVDASLWLGYDPERIERMGASGAVTQEGGRPRVLPDASLDVSSLSRFDARVKYAVRRVRMDNAPISNVALTLDLTRSLMTLSPFTFDIAGGHLASDIEINARNRPIRTRYDIRLSPTPMGVLLAGFGVEQAGTSGTIRARVQLDGTGDSVRESLGSSNGRIAFIMPRGTFWTRNVQLSELDVGTFVTKMWEKKLEEPVQINCGLIAFTVRNGLAAADPILIDTSKNVIAARGGFSFRTEAVDMAVEADAKTFSLFSGQSPVGVGGYFAEPNIDPISGELVGRAGIGLGLAALVSPVAAVLAFVDVGDAEDTACGPVLSGARASAQREQDGGRLSKVGAGKQAAVEEKPKRKKFLGIF